MSNQAHAGFPPWLVQQALAASAARAGRGLRVFGICGLQGSGKSTLAAQLVAAARQAGLAAASVSLDDFYLTAAQLAEVLLARLAESSGLPAVKLSEAALKALKAYAFPGNVRELENVLERALALCSGDAIGVDDLLLDPSDIGEASHAEPETPGGAPLQDYLDRVERHVIEEALEKTGGNRTAAARALGVTFRSLRYRLERLGIKE